VSRDSPKNALLVVLVTALVCSSLVSAAVVLLRPIQLNNQLLDQSRNIMQLTGLQAAGDELDDDEMLGLYKSVDRRIINISDAVFDKAIDPNTFDKRKAVNDPELGVQIPAGLDLASLGRRSRFAPVYIVWKDGELERMILPVRGAGMWSMLYGYIALESDLNTIAGMTFYEQNETPGLGDQITHVHWLEQWKGRRVFDEQGETRFRVSEGVVAAGSATSGYEVDALTGATVTGNAVTNMMHYWFGPHGYQDFLAQLRDSDDVLSEGGETL
jgi:Na+-transporting NADH:ubiquinone oxidoreductase subunit C